jgi:hypothetical protein
MIRASKAEGVPDLPQHEEHCHHLDFFLSPISTNGRISDAFGLALEIGCCTSSRSMLAHPTNPGAISVRLNHAVWIILFKLAATLQV